MKILIIVNNKYQIINNNTNKFNQIRIRNKYNPKMFKIHKSVMIIKAKNKKNLPALINEM